MTHQLETQTAQGRRLADTSSRIRSRKAIATRILAATATLAFSGIIAAPSSAAVGHGTNAGEAASIAASGLARNFVHPS